MSQKHKKTKRAGQGGAVPSLSCIEPNAAGIDVGATEIFVAVPQGRDPGPVRSFDRIIIAQAVVDEMTVLTSDRVFEKYPIDVVWCGE